MEQHRKETGQRKTGGENNKHPETDTSLARNHSGRKSAKNAKPTGKIPLEPDTRGKDTRISTKRKKGKTRRNRKERTRNAKNNTKKSKPNSTQSNAYRQTPKTLPGKQKKTSEKRNATQIRLVIRGGPLL